MINRTKGTILPSELYFSNVGETGTSHLYDKSQALSVFKNDLYTANANAWWNYSDYPSPLPKKSGTMKRLKNSEVQAQDWKKHSKERGKRAIKIMKQYWVYSSYTVGRRQQSSHRSFSVILTKTSCLPHKYARVVTQFSLQTVGFTWATLWSPVKVHILRFSV